MIGLIIGSVVFMGIVGAFAGIGIYYLISSRNEGKGETFVEGSGI